MPWPNRSPMPVGDSFGDSRNTKRHERAGSSSPFLPPTRRRSACFCGTLNQVPLSVRSFDCRGCKKTLDRDFNAAWIVLKRGLAQVGLDRPELKPVETGPLLPPTTGTTSLVGEAGTIGGEHHATQQEARRW